MEAKAENRLIEMFGAGTACVVSPFGSILYEDKVSDAHGFCFLSGLSFLIPNS